MNRTLCVRHSARTQTHSESADVNYLLLSTLPWHCVPTTKSTGHPPSRYRLALPGLRLDRKKHGEVQSMRDISISTQHRAYCLTWRRHTASLMCARLSTCQADASAHSRLASLQCWQAASTRRREDARGARACSTDVTLDWPSCERWHRRAECGVGPACQKFRASLSASTRRCFCALPHLSKRRRTHGRVFV